MGQTFVFGVGVRLVERVVGQGQKALVRVESWTWTSMPMVGS